MKLSAILQTLIFMTAAISPGIDITGYAKPDSGALSGSLVQNGGFESGKEHWSSLDGQECQTGAFGINQTGGLHYVRRNTDSYRRVSQVVKLKAGKRYRFGAMIRTAGVTGEGAGLYIEGYAKDKYVGGAYIHGRKGDSDWRLLEGDFTPPVEFPEASYRLSLYLRKGAVGEAWFDDVFLYENAPRLITGVAYPTHHTLRPDQPLRLFAHFDGEALPDQRNLVDYVQNGKVVFRKDFSTNSRNIIMPEFRLAPGAFEVVIRRIDPAARKILAESVIPMTFTDAAQPVNTTAIDKNGLLRMNGKLFMPLGLYLQNVTANDLDRIAASPFNTILPYQSTKLKMPGSKLAGDDAVEEALDECEKRNIKVIFSLKDLYGANDDPVVERLVNRFKSHPAILAWYICDEAAVDKVPKIAARRRLINRLDPGHPTYSVFYQYPDFHQYTTCQDVFGNDPYPINYRDDSHIEGTNHSTLAAESLGMPLWSVPQIHHTGFYNSDWRKNPVPYFQTLRAPNEEEMNTICLLEAMRLARGFVMYSYFDLGWGPDKLQFERRWPIVCRVAERLKSLEPYLLSDAAAPAVNCTAAKGKVYARAFQAADGPKRVIVCQVSSGEGEAEITIGNGETGYLSENGRTVEVSPGRYRFFGKNTTWDILRKNQD